MAILQRLAQRVQARALELRKLVEEEHSVVGESLIRHLQGLWHDESRDIRAHQRGP
jgi:hypothetical protein